MKIIDISEENSISSNGCFNCVKTTPYLYKMTPLKVEDSSIGQANYINNAGEIITIPSGNPTYFYDGL